MVKRSPSLKLVKLAAQAASDKLGQDMIALDVRHQTSVTDIFLFVGANSHTHVRALEDEIRTRLKENGANLIRTDGQRGQQWRVLDYGSLIVHIMDQKTREFYAVERLWNQAKQIDVTGKEPPKPRKKPRSSSPRKRGSRS